jgi:hypothetical protein
LLRGFNGAELPSRAAATSRADTRLMPLAVLVVTFAQLLDLGTFAAMIDVHGIASEANPFVSHMLLNQGLPFAAVAKLAALSLVVAVIVVLGDRRDRAGHPRLARTIAGLAVLAGIIGGLTNALVLV